jgi:hypothetical protein
MMTEHQASVHEPAAHRRRPVGLAGEGTCVAFPRKRLVRRFTSLGRRLTGKPLRRGRTAPRNRLRSR